MGLEVVVQQVMIQDRTLYRVRVGPFTHMDELNKTRSQLAQSGIESQLAK
jgi:cell division protein FtsN